jgi:PAS domain S-box-containing protein
MGLQGEVNLAEAQLARRRATLGLTAQDRELLLAARPLVEPHWPAFLDNLYQHMRAQPEIAPLLGHMGTLDRLKQHQHRYLHSLFGAPSDAAHARSMVTTGLVHYRLRITPQWYIATYAHFICGHVDSLLAQGVNGLDGKRAVIALIKSIFYDISLVLDAYGAGESRTLRERRDQQISSPDHGKSDAPDSGSIAPGQDCATSPISRVRLTGDEVARRREFVGISQADLAALGRLDPLMQARMPVVLDDFYEFLSADPETAAMVAPNTVGRLKRQVASYWQELVTSQFGRPYAASRMRIGVMHHRIGLSLQWYLGGLARQLIQLIEPDSAVAADPEVVKALVRAVVFDLTFVIDAYMEARAEALVRGDGYANDLISGMTAAIAVLDADLRVVSANPALLELVPGSASLVYRMPATMALTIPEVATVLTRMGSSRDERAVALGRLAGKLLRITCLRLAARKDMPDGGFALVLDDVSELLRLSQDADSDSQRLAEVAQSACAVLWEIDCASRVVVSMSTPVLDLTGYRDVYFLGRADNWLACIWPPDRERVLRQMDSMPAGGRRMIEHRLVHADGRELWVQSHVTRSSVTASASTWRGVSVDVTEAKRQQKLHRDAIGLMAGSMAHVLNNQLMAVSGSIELQARKLGGMMRFPLLKQAMEELGRAAEVTDQLLAFSGRKALRPESLDMDATLSEQAQLMQLEFGAGTTVLYAPEGALWNTVLDRTAFVEALWTIARNAREAMTQGGTITLKARNLHGEELEADDPCIGSDWVEVDVGDTGSGMSFEIRSRALDPFFSTKSEVEGHYGLGLSMLYGFVTQSGGHLDLMSEEGTGTTLRMRFPRLVERDGRNPHGPMRTPSVLVVEDHPLVRDVALQFVEMLGYDALAVESAATALETLKSKSFDVILTDIQLGQGLDGVELARIAERMRPGLGVVLMSGYTAEHIHLERLPGHYLFLNKPFTRDGLAAALAQAVESMRTWVST